METYIINTILVFFLVILVGIAIVSAHYRRKYEELKIRYEDLRNISDRVLNMVQEQLR